jgi:hypothetical protein
VAKIVGKEEEAVRKLCVRHRTKYFNKLVRGSIPDEARTALALGVLRELYPPAVTSGQFGWGEYDAQISAVFPEPPKIVLPSAYSFTIRSTLYYKVSGQGDSFMPSPNPKVLKFPMAECSLFLPSGNWFESMTLTAGFPSCFLGRRQRRRRVCCSRFSCCLQIAAC